MGQGEVKQFEKGRRAHAKAGRNKEHEVFRALVWMQPEHTVHGLS